MQNLLMMRRKKDWLQRTPSATCARVGLRRSLFILIICLTVLIQFISLCATEDQKVYLIVSPGLSEAEYSFLIAVFAYDELNMPTVIQLSYEEYAAAGIEQPGGMLPPKAILKVEPSRTGLHYQKMIEASETSTDIRSLEQAMISLAYGSYSIYSAAYETVTEDQIIGLYHLGMSRVHGATSANFTEAVREMDILSSIHRSLKSGAKDFSSERLMDALYLMKGELLGLGHGTAGFDSAFKTELSSSRLASMLYEAMRMDPNIEISNEDLKSQLEQLLTQDPVLQKNLVDLFVAYLNMDASSTVGDDLNAWLQEQGEFLQRFWHSLRESKIWKDTLSEFRSLVDGLLPSQ